MHMDGRTRRLTLGAVLGLAMIGGGVAVAETTGTRAPVGATPSAVHSSPTAASASATSTSTASATATASSSVAANASSTAVSSASASSVSPSATPSNPHSGLASRGDTAHCAYTEAELRAARPNAKVEVVGKETRFLENGIIIGITTNGSGWGPPCTLS